jgi:hypothetical protein
MASKKMEKSKNITKPLRAGAAEAAPARCEPRLKFRLEKLSVEAAVAVGVAAALLGSHDQAEVEAVGGGVAVVAAAAAAVSPFLNVSRLRMKSSCSFSSLFSVANAVT